jgi:hypothetical protein
MNIGFQQMKSFGYSKAQTALHWLSAVVVVWLLFFGPYVSQLTVECLTAQRAGFVNGALATLYIPIVVGLYCSFFQGGSCLGSKRSRAVDLGDPAHWCGDQARPVRSSGTQKHGFSLVELQVTTW